MRGVRGRAPGPAAGRLLGHVPGDPVAPAAGGSPAAPGRRGAGVARGVSGTASGQGMTRRSAEDRIGRRAFIAAFAGLVAAPLPLEAQPAPKVAKIGVLTPTSPAGTGHLVEAFRQALLELGHVEGKTFALLLRYGEGKAERLPELARELVRLKVDVIVTGTDVGITAAKRETQTIPIVMTNSTDPVATGFVASLAHPGGNVTGLTSIA